MVNPCIVAGAGIENAAQPIVARAHGKARLLWIGDYCGLPLWQQKPGWGISIQRIRTALDDRNWPISAAKAASHQVRLVG